MIDQGQSPQLWQSRVLAGGIVVMLHSSVFLIGANKDVETVVKPSAVAYVVQAPILEPKPEPTLLGLTTVVAAPAFVEPEFLIEAPLIAAAINNDWRVNTSDESAGGSGESASVGRNAGNGTGENNFTKCANRIMPVYTRDALAANISGKVILLVKMNEHGKFDSIAVARSSGSRSLDAASVAAIKRWRCSPVIENGRAVSVEVKQEFNFSIR